ncbi:MAG: integrase [Rhodospirillaceae bacterium]|nr:integrase [Rhodospirillaceae bacterium]
MASIRSRNSRYQVQVRRAGLGSRSRTFVRKQDAERWARKMEAQFDQGELQQLRTKDVVLHDLIDRYRREITPAKKGRDQEGGRLARLMRDPIASFTVQKLTAHELARFRDRRIKDGIRTCQYDLFLIRHILEIARKEWNLGLAVNPVDQIRKPNGLKPRNRRLEESEYRRLEESMGQTRVPYLWPLINLAIETAMRRGELLSLQWDWIDKDLRLVHLPDTKNGHPRSVPLSPSAMYWLDQMPVVGQMVFPVTPVAVRQAWDRLLRRAGIRNLHFHDLRHEAISRFFELGLSIPEVALISGHRDPRMLFRYTHLRAEDVAEKLNINKKTSK